MHVLDRVEIGRVHLQPLGGDKSAMRPIAN